MNMNLFSHPNLSAFLFYFDEVGGSLAADASAARVPELITTLVNQFIYR